MFVFKIDVREIFYFYGYFIVEVDFCILKVLFRVVMFSGILIGVYGVLEFWSNDKIYYMGKDVLNVVEYVNKIIEFVLISKKLSVWNNRRLIN